MTKIRSGSALYGWCMTNQHEDSETETVCPGQVNNLSPCACDCHEFNDEQEIEE